MHVPPSETAGAFFYDALNNVFILIGEFTGTNFDFTTDTWQWDRVQWTKLNPAQHPANFGHPFPAFAPYDTQNHFALMLIDDNQHSGTNNTWQWDSATKNWVQQNPNTTPPTDLQGYVAVYDSVRHRVTLFGGALYSNNQAQYLLWFWDGADWSSQGGGPGSGQIEFNSASFAPDWVSQDGITGVMAFFDWSNQFTWEYDGTNWHAYPIAVFGVPVLQEFTNTVYDAHRHVMVMFSGFRLDNFEFSNDTYEYAGQGNWTKVATAHKPAVREACSLVYDPVQHKVLMFGGDGPSSNDIPLGDFWSYDGVDWTLLNVTSIASFSPSGGNLGASVSIVGNSFTNATDVLFNGTSVGVGNFTIVDDQHITAIVPGGATTGKITVVGPGNTVLSATDFTVTVAPVVDSFDPLNGPVGKSVTILGANFTAATSVKFNGTAVVSFVVVNDQTITTTVPSKATTGPVSVTTLAGIGTSSTNFIVTVPVVPPAERSNMPIDSETNSVGAPGLAHETNAGATPPSASQGLTRVAQSGVAGGAENPGATAVGAGSLVPASPGLTRAGGVALGPQPQNANIVGAPIPPTVTQGLVPGAAGAAMPIGAPAAPQIVSSTTPQPVVSPTLSTAKPIQPSAQPRPAGTQMVVQSPPQNQQVSQLTPGAPPPNTQTATQQTATGTLTSVSTLTPQP